MQVIVTYEYKLMFSQEIVKENIDVNKFENRNPKMNEGIRVGRRGKTMTIADEKENSGSFPAWMFRGVYFLPVAPLPLMYNNQGFG